MKGIRPIDGLLTISEKETNPSPVDKLIPTDSDEFSLSSVTSSLAGVYSIMATVSQKRKTD